MLSDHKKLLFSLILILITLGLIVLIVKHSFVSDNNIDLGKSYSMTITSPDFSNNGIIPERYTCHGANVNPTLEIDKLPTSTKSLVLIVDDPDAPRGDWVHWLLWNINPRDTKISSGQNMAGALVGVNDFGHNKYDGPCPPSGTHHYQFKVYALDTALNLGTDTSKPILLNAMKNHVLDQATLIGLSQ